MTRTVLDVQELLRQKAQAKRERLTRIRELFTQLKKGYDYIQDHNNEPRKCDVLMERAKPIFTELETLGVGRLFSQALIVFGPELTDELVSQFN